MRLRWPARSAMLSKKCFQSFDYLYRISIGTVVASFAVVAGVIWTLITTSGG
jgi:hypothetical protein